MTNTTANAVSRDAAALSALTASATDYNPDCARILYGSTGNVDRALSDYADSEYQETYDVSRKETFALIVFASPEQARKAERDIATRINVSIYDANGNPSDDGN